MTPSGKTLLIGGGVVLAAALGAAIVLHGPEVHRHLAGLHGAGGLHGGAGLHASGPAAVMVGESGGDPVRNAQAREGVAAIGRRWDQAAFDATVTLYTEVHRGVAWPGVLEPELVHYGPSAEQTFELYRPEQGFSEPGPVFLFLSGNGLGSSAPLAPGSDGLIYRHLGKLGAMAGGLGVLMSYREAAGAEDLRLVIDWIVDNIAPYGGDPDTIVILANAEGATTTAAYLFDENRQTSAGPRVAAALLASGRFGGLAPEIEPLIAAYKGERVPLALWTGEYDTEEVAAGIDDLNTMLCRKYDDCPWTEMIAGHNAVSHVMSLGTADTSALNAFIRFYHTVR
jgi:arylformamidase